MAMPAEPRGIRLVAPPATNPFTGGHLFNARVAAASPPGACALRALTTAELLAELRAPAGPGVLVLDSLFLPELDPASWRGHEVLQLVHSLPERERARVDAALALARGCLTTSEFMAERVRARVPGARVRVCLPGVEATLRARAQPGATPVVLTVAHFERRKGHLALLHALERIRDLPWRWQIIGDLDADPGCGDDFRAAAGSSGLADRIELLGIRPPAEVQDAMAAADLFALLSENEPYGMVFAESVASGTPVVAWRQGGVLESVRPGQTGLLAPAGDVAVAAQHLRMLVASPTLRARMRLACAAAAPSFPSWATCARGFLQACQELAGTR
jgi:glycosyltransferase involved in cell wall biosynthesis